MYRTLAVNKDYAENNFRLPRLDSICSDVLGDSPVVLVIRTGAYPSHSEIWSFSLRFKAEPDGDS